MKGWPHESKPLLVFWETTKSCLLACRHCRAEAITRPLPGELTTEEGYKLIDDVASFGKPSPILVFTGGDPLMRRDIWDLVSYATRRGIRVAMAPAVTKLLDEEAAENMKRYGVRAVSISLDSGVPEIHDGIRGIRGTWRRTVEAIKMLLSKGIRVQVNMLVSRDTAETIPETIKLILDLGVPVLEAFYIVPVGRAAEEMMLSPQEFEDVSHLLYEASKYGLVVRTTEGPMFRRVSLERMTLERNGYNPDEVLRTGPLYAKLIEKMRRILGEPVGEARASTTGTRDGKGIIFVAYNGDVYPSGFMPYSLGNVKEDSLVRIYREHPLLKRIRRAEFHGRCGACEFRDICGGSRARAYMVTGDPLGEDPACPYRPGEFTETARRLGIDTENLPILPPLSILP